jgi:hypothetical protein
MGAVASGNYFYCIGTLWSPQWKHYAAVFTKGQQRLYENGTLVATANNNNYCPTVSDPLVIGKKIGDTFLNGYITEIRISNIVRYTSNFTSPNYKFTPDNKTVALYYFNEDSGNILHDASGNGNNGIIYNAIWSTDVPFNFTSINEKKINS